MTMTSKHKSRKPVRSKDFADLQERNQLLLDKKPERSRVELLVDGRIVLTQVVAEVGSKLAGDGD